jgi:hypothetical protein
VSGDGEQREPLERSIAARERLDERVRSGLLEAIATTEPEKRA